MEGIPTDYDQLETSEWGLDLGDISQAGPFQDARLSALISRGSPPTSWSRPPEASNLEDDALAAQLQSWFRLWAAEGFFPAIG